MKRPLLSIVLCLAISVSESASAFSQHSLTFVASAYTFENQALQPPLEVGVINPITDSATDLKAYAQQLLQKAREITLTEAQGDKPAQNELLKELKLATKNTLKDLLSSIPTPMTLERVCRSYPILVIRLFQIHGRIWDPLLNAFIADLVMNNIRTLYAEMPNSFQDYPDRLLTMGAKEKSTTDEGSNKPKNLSVETASFNPVVVSEATGLLHTMRQFPKGSKMRPSHKNAALAFSKQVAEFMFSRNIISWDIAPLSRIVLPYAARLASPEKSLIPEPNTLLEEVLIYLIVLEVQDLISRLGNLPTPNSVEIAIKRCCVLDSSA